ncbi:actin cross-linking [Lipomyces arxii]|uniref:actin cross-linking n=1 Tax=Lipomyces arxii TaxID=56418 RepID=UPI0034CE5C4F
MVSKLTFKNDKPKKRKREKHVSYADLGDDEFHPKKSSGREVGGAEELEVDAGEGWVTALSTDYLDGPCMFILNDSPPVCMSSDGAGKTFTTPISSLDPTNVQQVWVIGSIVQSEKYTLKSYLGKYLTVSKFGVCEASAEAIGPEQEFEIEHEETGNGWVIKSIYGKYLSLNGKDIRCDSEVSGFKETLLIRSQAKFRKRTKKVVDESEMKIHTKELEEKVGAPLDYDTIKLLKKAFKEGHLNEAILDVREKLKTDHRC